MSQGSWDQVAGVRSAPERYLSAEKGKLYFSPDLFMALQHPAVTDERGLAVPLAAHRLMLYLDFTTALESLIVNPVLSSLGTGRLAVGLSGKERAAAWDIYVDEAYHARSAFRLAMQVAAATGITHNFRESHGFQRVVDQHLGTGSVDPEVVGFASAVVSETLISGTLQLLPRDERVYSAIRQSVHDHEQDERRHHAFFVAIFPGVWNQMTAKEREKIGPMLADFVRGFLEPDVASLRTVLTPVLGTTPLADEILELMVSEPDLDARIRRSARATLNLFTKVGVLDVSPARERFEELCLTTN